MKLYHYTTYKNVLKIMYQGIKTTDVDRADGTLDDVAWLSTNSKSHLQKWSASTDCLLTEQEHHDYLKAFGSMPPKGAMWPNKREIRFTLIIPDNDPKLIRWTDYAGQYVDPRYAKELARSGGPKQYLEWYLYQGHVSPDFIKDVTWYDTAISKFRDENPQFNKNAHAA